MRYRAPGAFALLGALAFACACASDVNAQSTVGDSLIGHEAPPGRDVFGPTPSASGKGGYQRDNLALGGLGVPIGTMWVFPSVAETVTYDDNIFASKTGRIGDTVSRTTGSTVLRAQQGLNDLFAYGTIDGRVYARQSSFDNVGGRAGFVDFFELSRDTVVRFQGEYARNNELPGSAAYFAATSAALKNPVTSNEGYGSVSVNQNFGIGYVSAGGSVLAVRYENPTAANGTVVDETYRNGVVYSAMSRLGYYITPLLSAYVEPSYNQRQYESTKQGNFNSDGFEVRGGLATDRIGLYKGEIYGGYTDQIYENARLGEFNGATYGAKLTYLADRQLSISGSVDQRLGESAYLPAIAGGVGIGSVTWNTVARLQAEYAVSPALTWATFGEYSRSEYVKTPRNDDIYKVGSSVSYAINRYFSAGVGYQFSTLSSSVSALDYDKNEVFVNMKGRF